MKEFLTAAQAEHTGDTAQRSYDPDDDVITAGEALFLFRCALFVCCSVAAPAASDCVCVFVRRDLRQEVTVLAQLTHPNIVCLLGVSIRPMCMVIEYAPMGSLFGILDKRVEQFKAAQADSASVILRMPGGVLGHEISVRMALQVCHWSASAAAVAPLLLLLLLLQVALALRYLHSHGVVYRDLKSDNVLVWSQDVEEAVNIKLADYGISRFANPGGVKGEEGTPGYLAPEAIRRRGEDQAFDEKVLLLCVRQCCCVMAVCSMKVDIFSYAMLLFELLTGQRPFETLTTTQELNRAVTQGERPLVADGNAGPAFPAFIDLMYDCWKHSSSERPSADEVSVPVCVCVCSADPPPPPPRSWSTASVSLASCAASIPSSRAGTTPSRR